VSITTALLV